ncbi:DUF2203 domain-containing protein [Paenibacillus humicola]|uniref:DUF2203 domain-containing protein n=1 Tax=Paenibacillus humicola TaxID=3110540 RepID=UPI00237BDC62|nr:DUF2203 domain-containing protein [Paenibacillus humicola]
MFTLSEANAMLPELNRDLQKLQRLTAQFADQSAELRKRKAAEGRPAGRSAEGGADPFFEQEAKLEFMRMEADLMIDNFSRKGVLLKMIDPGLIDFPAVVDGRNALICWKQGEERVAYYHGWDEGFIGRKRHPEA